MIDVVIVNWNSGSRLRACLRSLERNRARSIGKVLVIDNASDDDSVRDALEFSSRSFEFRTIMNASNEGFAAACNKAARVCQSEFILFLNPDCELFGDTVEQLIAGVHQTGSAGYVLFGIPLVDEKGVIARSCARQPSAADFWIKIFGLDRLSAGRIRGHIMTEWPHDDSRDVHHVMGAFYLIRRDVFGELGGFDEQFFVYLEDLDLSRRVLEAGYRIRFLANARAFHEGGGSSKNIKAMRLFYSLRSRMLFGLKHFSAMAAWGLVAGTMIFEPLVRLTFAVGQADREQFRQTARGYWLLWSQLPRLLGSRGHALANPSDALRRSQK